MPNETQERKHYPVGVYIAVAALLVNLPRLIIMFLQADGIELPKSLEGWMLGISGAATGIVLSGGGAYIAHTVAQPKPRPKPATVALLVTWFALLFFTVALLAPSLVLALRKYGLAAVLVDGWQQWTWSVVAVVSVEVLAAGAMVAHAIETAPAPEPGAQPVERKPGFLRRLFDALGDLIVNRLQKAAQPAQPEAQPFAFPAMQPAGPVAPNLLPVAPAAPEPAPVADPAPEPDTVEAQPAAPKMSKDERYTWLLAKLHTLTDESQINQTAWAKELGVSRQQVADDLKYIRKNMAEALNGAGQFLG